MAVISSAWSRPLITQRQSQVYLVVDSVDHGACNTPAVPVIGQDFSPQVAVVTIVAAQHDHAVLGHVADVVDHRACQQRRI